MIYWVITPLVTRIDSRVSKFMRPYDFMNWKQFMHHGKMQACICRHFPNQVQTQGRL
ncbi:hypothetical protein WAI453_012868 [Rhynchosporium graminicola]